MDRLNEKHLGSGFDSFLSDEGLLSGAQAVAAKRTSAWQAALPNLEPGRTYRTHELQRFGANPSRLARRLVREGKLRRAAHGLYYAPIPSRFGDAPPPDEELLRAFLGGSPFVVTGPPRWNSLGLGSTAMLAATLVYNRKRTGEFTIDDRRFLLRRVYFPEARTPEWFVVDLVQHRDMAGVQLAELEERLVVAIREGRWDRERLRAMAVQYGTKATLALVDGCLQRSEVAKGAHP